MISDDERQITALWQHGFRRGRAPRRWASDSRAVGWHRFRDGDAHSSDNGYGGAVPLPVRTAGLYHASARASTGPGRGLRGGVASTIVVGGLKGDFAGEFGQRDAAQRHRSIE
jgi:hypothetical protein